MTMKYKLEKDNAILLVIDLQERLVPAMNDPEQLVKQADVLLHVAKTFALPVVATEQYPRGLGRTMESLLELMGSDEINATIVEKIHFTALTQEVNDFLVEHDRKQIIVIGAETHVCVYQTVRDLRAKGYEVFVPYDAVESRTKENKDAALALFREMGAVVTSTETILFDLLQKAGTPEFKALSALIK